MRALYTVVVWIVALLATIRVGAAEPLFLPETSQINRLQQTLHDYEGIPDKQPQVMQLKATIARWQALPQDLGNNYLFVNIPAYRLDVVENHRTMLTMKVIVGKAKRPTPTLVSAITHLMLYPYWTVPRSIAVRELLPKVARDPSYLARHGFTVVDSQGRDIGRDYWQLVGQDGYRLRQNFGDRNALGTIKFMFPNNYSIYLHDTDAKKLFDLDARALSHGCVRVEAPLALAQYLTVAGHTGYAGETIAKWLADKRHTAVPLTTPVIIYIQYMTAEVASDGQVYFWKDIYNLDTRLPRVVGQ